MSTRRMLLLVGTTIRHVFEDGLRLDCGNSMQVTSACADQCYLLTKPSAKEEASVPASKEVKRYHQTGKVVYHQTDNATLWGWGGG